jgi:hypothetical protein
MPSPPPKMAPDSPTPMTGAKDLTMAMENAEQEEEFISNESFIGESYPPSEVNDNSLIMDGRYSYHIYLNEKKTI